MTVGYPRITPITDKQRKITSNKKAKKQEKNICIWNMIPYLSKEMYTFTPFS